MWCPVHLLRIVHLSLLQNICINMHEFLFVPLQMMMMIIIITIAIIYLFILQCE